MTSPILVTHIVTDLARGGAESFLQRLVAASGQTGVCHRVISLTTEGALAPEIRAAGADVSALSLAGAAGAPLALARLVRILRRQSPDVIMTWLYHADFFGTMAAALVPRVKLVWNIRCADMDMSKYGMTSRALPHVLARLSRRPDVVVANSEAGRAIHAAYGYQPRRWEILPNGFDIEHFRPDAERRAKVRSNLRIDPATPVVGLFARFDPMKDHATFLAAAAEIVQSRPEARFLLVGRGTDGPDFDRLIADREGLRHSLIRLGERTDVPELMAAVDVAVCSSLTEGFPNAIGEAMSCAIPCVTTDVGDAAQIVGDTGRVVPKGDWRALALQLRDMLDLTPNARGALGAAARRRVEERFSLAAVAARYAELFRELAASR
jgi:glycosyltransferase involved in cell wall biosynthesis